MTIARVCTLALVLMAPVSPARAQGKVVPIDQVVEAAAAPAGMFAARTVAPDLFEAMIPSVPSDRRLVELFVTPADLDTLEAGGLVVLRRPLLVMVMSATDGKPISEVELAHVAQKLERGLGESGDVAPSEFGDETFVEVHRREHWGHFHTKTVAAQLATPDGLKPWNAVTASGMLRIGGQVVFADARYDASLPNAKEEAQRALDAWANAAHAADPLRDDPGGVPPKNIQRNSMAWPIAVFVGTLLMFLLARRKRQA